MSFELADLQRAAERYPGHYEGTHGIWPRLVWERREEPPERRLDDAVDFLGKWKALRFKGGGEKLRAAYKNWFSNSQFAIRQLRGRALYDLIPNDFHLILTLSASLRERGIPSTTFGKLLHFLIPETALLWDQKIVRNTYKLDGSPLSFVSYQRFGNRLLHHVSRGKSPHALQELERSHARSAGYFEPMTMILDHLAYFSDESAKAVAALGGREKAFL